jgi:hypothetical protein
VFVDRIESNNGRVSLHCHVEETLGRSALEIPAWMFDSPWKQMHLGERPAVDCGVLRNLKLLLAEASDRDRIVKEAQRLEGGADAKTTKPKTVSAGIISNPNQDADLASDGPRSERQNDAVASTVAAQHWQRRNVPVPMEAGHD